MSAAGSTGHAAPAGGASRRPPSYGLAGLVALAACLVFFGAVFVAALGRVGGLSFGYRGFADLLLSAATVFAVAGLVAAAVIAFAAARAGRAQSVRATDAPAPAAFGAAAAASEDGDSPLRAFAGGGGRVARLVLAAALVLGSMFSFLAFNALGLGYGVTGPLVSAGADVIALVGVGAGVVVAGTAFLSPRATSLRTRTFGVIVVTVLIPSFCLATLGVWAYYRSWETATTLALDQAGYRASELAREIDSVQRQSRRYTAAQRARLAAAIAGMYGTQGHQEGAQLATLDQIRRTRTLPLWVIASLVKRGFAVGTERGPAPLGEADIVAWRVGPDIVRYYVPVWTGETVSPRSSSTGSSGSPPPAWPSSSSSVSPAPGSSRAASCGRCGGWRRRAAGSPKAKPASPSRPRGPASCGSSPCRSTT